MYPVQSFTKCHTCSIISFPKTFPSVLVYHKNSSIYLGSLDMYYNKTFIFMCVEVPYIIVCHLFLHIFYKILSTTFLVYIVYRVFGLEITYYLLAASGCSTNTHTYFSFEKFLPTDFSDIPNIFFKILTFLVFCMDCLIYQFLHVKRCLVNRGYTKSWNSDVNK